MDREENRQKLRILQVRNAPHVERKPHYLQERCVDVSLDQEVWRIFKAPFLLSDLSKNEMTLPEITVQGIGKNNPESGENPFLSYEFPLKEEGLDQNSVVTLPFLADYYGHCWSKKDLYQSWAWTEFAKNDVGILVKSTVKKVIDQLMNLRNENYFFKYFCLKIYYETEENLAYWKQNTPYTDFLGSLGLETLKALSWLPRGLHREEEVRFVYTTSENENNFPEAKIIHKDGIRLCKHPFIWRDIIDEIWIDNRQTNSVRENYARDLEKLGLSCTINWI